MLTPLDYVTWVLGVVLYLGVSAITIRKREFLKYLVLNTYVLMTASCTVGEWLVYVKYGYTSAQYAYFFYYSESFLSILLYVVVSDFYSELMESIGAGRTVRLATLLLAVGTALTAFSIVESHRDHMNSRFVVELGRDLNFVGGLLVYVLLIALAKTPAPSRRWVQMVSALGIYFFCMALAYGLIAIAPGLSSITIPFLLVYGVSYFFTEFGPNVTTFVYPAEVFPVMVRTTAHGIAAALGKVGAFIGAFAFPYLLTIYHLQGAMLVAALVSLIGLILTLLTLPEPNQRTLEEISDEHSVRATYEEKRELVLR